MACGTALIYDEEMTRYKLLWEDSTCEVEVPERLMVSVAALRQLGLYGRCVPLPVREAADEDILLAHSEGYLEAVKKTPFMSVEGLKSFCQQFSFVFCHPNMYHCAKLAVGAVLQLVDGVMTGQVKNGMALVRPPGHHSQRNEANGFCIFNNVAIAALYAQKRFGVKRVLIVDWDVHHGQGVQYFFEQDPSVLYFSWHRYEHQQFWPNLSESDYSCVGKGQGAGFNINLPWNKVGMGNSDYLSAFFHVLLPAAYEFCPELVLVSAGFDSGIGDPEGHMMATPDVFAHLTHLLMPLAGGKLCVVLEGGYNLTCLAQSVCQTVQTLLGDPVPRPAGLTGPCLSALESIQCVRAAHRQHWGCFRHAAGEVAEPSTNRCELSGDGQVSGGAETVTWAEPAPRLAPPVRTAAAVPADAEDWLPQSCLRVTGSPQHREEAEGALRNMGPTASIEEGELQSLGSVFALLGEILAKKVRNGLALVPDSLAAVAHVMRKVLASVADRIMWVFLGDDEVPVDIAEDNRVLVLQICSREVVARTGFHVPVCVGKSNSSAVLHAVLSLLLPLAYEFDPRLVLLTVTDWALGDAKYAHLIHLLQGLADGQMLALLPHPCTQNMLRTTACCLLGNSIPSLDPLGPADPEDVQKVKSQRHRLQSQWTLLKTTATKQSPEDQREQHI